MSDIDNQFSIAGIQFSILVLPRNNFERFLKPQHGQIFRLQRSNTATPKRTSTILESMLLLWKRVSTAVIFFPFIWQSPLYKKLCICLGLPTEIFTNKWLHVLCETAINNFLSLNWVLHITMITSGKLSPPITPELVYIHNKTVKVLRVYIHSLISANWYIFRVLAFSEEGKKYLKSILHDEDPQVRNKPILFSFNRTRSHNSKTADIWQLWSKQLRYNGAIPRYFRTDKINWTLLTIIVFGLWTLDRLIRVSPGNNDELSGFFVIWKVKQVPNILWNAGFLNAHIIQSFG